MENKKKKKPTRAAIAAFLLAAILPTASYAQQVAPQFIYDENGQQVMAKCSETFPALYYPPSNTKQRVGGDTGYCIYYNYSDEDIKKISEEVKPAYQNGNLLIVNGKKVYYFLHDCISPSFCPGYTD